jgi:tetratricopeptide (TPR) repeat protein
MINALFDLLGTFYQSGEFAQAEWMARSILQAIPDDLVSLQLLGLVYYRTRRRSEAMQAFNAAEGDVHRPTGSLHASAQCLQAASGHGSTLAGAWYELGLLLFRLRRFPQAISALQAALSARPRFLSGAARYCTHRKASRRQEFRPPKRPVYMRLAIPLR